MSKLGSVFLTAGDMLMLSRSMYQQEKYLDDQQPGISVDS